MNIAQLKLSQKKLLDNLVSRGYDIQYIKGVKFVLRLLFEHEGCFHSYEQFAEKFIRTRGYTKATLDLRMMHLRTIQAYDEFGHRNIAQYMLCQIPGSWYGLPYGFPPQLHAPIEFHQ